MPHGASTKKLQAGVKQAIVATSAYKDKIYLAFLLCTVLFAACFFQLFTMQPVFYKTQWHFNETFIGVLMSANGLLIIAVEMVLIHKLEGRRHPLVFVAFGIMMMALGFALTNLLPVASWSAFIIILFITFGEIMSIPFMNTFWLARANPGNMGQYAALYSMAWSVAQIVAPVLGGEAIARSGYPLLWWLLVVICMVAALGFITLYRIKERKNAASSTA